MCFKNQSYSLQCLLYRFFLQKVKGVGLGFRKISLEWVPSLKIVINLPGTIRSFTVKEEGHLFRDYFSWECGCTLPQNSCDLPRTYKKLHCKREPYRFSSQRDPLLHTQTDILLLLYSDVIIFFGSLNKNLSSSASCKYNLVKDF